jgi:ankyrin repeat protein
MVNIDAQDNEGNTPLHVAATNGHGRIVRLLMDHGADSSIINRQGFTASDLARLRGHHGVAQMIDTHADRMFPPGTPFRAATKMLVDGLRCSSMD